MCRRESRVLDAPPAASEGLHRSAWIARALFLGAILSVGGCWFDPRSGSEPEWSLGAILPGGASGLPGPPLPVTSGIAFHLDAGAATPPDGTALSAWIDSGPLGYHPNAPAAAPVYQANSVGGRAAIRFPAAPSSAHFINSAVSSLGQNLTVVFIFKRNTAAAYGHLFSLGEACPGGADDAYNVYITADGRINLDRRLVTLLLAATVPVVDLAPHIGILRSDASGPLTSLYLDGTLDAQSVVGYFFDTDPVLIVGNNCTFASSFDGDIAELVAYNRALSVAEIDALHCYAASKYGVTVGATCGN